MSYHDCPTCTCESPGDRERRLAREKAEAIRKQREIEFVRRHSVLTADDLAWAAARREQARTSADNNYSVKVKDS